MTGVPWRRCGGAGGAACLPLSCQKRTPGTRNASPVVSSLKGDYCNSAAQPWSAARATRITSATWAFHAKVFFLAMMQLTINILPRPQTKFETLRARPALLTFAATAVCQNRYFLASARFVEKKNLARLIQAYGLYRQNAEAKNPSLNHPTEGLNGASRNTDQSPWDLVLLGDGPLKPELCRLISAGRLTGHVHLPGFKQYDELPLYYGLASAFVHASSTEQWGLVVNEAMASALPVLVSNRCGCAQELVAEGVNGFSFDPSCVEQLAALMQKLSAAGFPRAAFAAESRRMVGKVSVEQFGDNLKMACEHALSNHRTRKNQFALGVTNALIHLSGRAGKSTLQIGDGAGQLKSKELANGAPESAAHSTCECGKAKIAAGGESMKGAVRVVHVTSWLSPRGGGIPPVILGLDRENLRLGLESLTAGLRDRASDPDPAVQGVNRILCDAIGPSSFSFSKNLKCHVAAETTESTVIHSHGLWMHPGVVAREISTSTGAPLVVSPHGMLEPWALKNSRWKKQVALWLFENKNLRHAACLHALCRAEARNLRDFGLRNPIAVIPNGIDFHDFSDLPDYHAIESDHPELKGKKRMIFLARIHPKKGLPHLLKAWAALASEFEDWVLLVGGKEQLGHEAEMKKLAADLGIAESIIFPGPLYGQAKRNALAGSDAFVLPSFSEGFSMAVLEAAASRLPVLLTPQCNFPELTAAGGAIEVQPDMESCEAGLRRMFSYSDGERKSMGARGCELIRKNYTWPAIAAQMATVYAWLLGQVPKPEFVWVN